MIKTAWFVATIALRLGVLNLKGTDIEEFEPSQYLDEDMSAQGPSRRIYGGVSVEKGQYPFVVRIENFDHEVHEQLHCCTGSLIAPEWVLTAAHCELCVVFREVRIRYGHVDAKWDAPNTYSNVSALFKHPGYFADPYKLHQGEKLNDELLRHFVYQNDIALLKVEPIPLPAGRLSSVEYTTIMGKKTVIAGYGIMALRPIIIDNTLALSQPLQKAEVMVKQCEHSLVLNSFPIICVTHQCAKGAFGETVMPGDSGGPMLFDDKVIGVCSYGFHALHGSDLILKETGFYTAVAPYLDWINSVIGASAHEVIEEN